MTHRPHRHLRGPALSCLGCWRRELARVVTSWRAWTAAVVLAAAQLLHGMPPAS